MDVRPSGMGREDDPALRNRFLVRRLFFRGGPDCGRRGSGRRCGALFADAPLFPLRHCLFFLSFRFRRRGGEDRCFRRSGRRFAGRGDPILRRFGLRRYRGSPDKEEKRGGDRERGRDEPKDVTPEDAVCFPCDRCCFFDRCIVQRDRRRPAGFRGGL